MTYLVPEAERGRAVGRVVSGVMLGIMLARPLSSFIADAWSWHATFGISASVIAVMAVVLRFALPERWPSRSIAYGELLESMGRLFVETPILRRRAIYHAFMFGCFSVFWTAIPLWLTGPRFGLSQRGVAWVALAGVAGAIAPPFAGRLADHGRSRLGTVLAMLTAAGAFILSLCAMPESSFGLPLVVAVAAAVDFAVASNLVFGQRAIFALAPEQRSRLNALYMATFFVGGAAGSAVSAWLYTRHGWPAVAAFGAALPCIGLLYLATEKASSPSRTTA